jgi:carbamoylphosphate synthase small subunit
LSCRDPVPASELDGVNPLNQEADDGGFYIARHAINLNLTEISPLTLIGMGVLVLPFAAGRHVYRMSAGSTGENQVPEARLRSRDATG